MRATIARMKQLEYALVKLVYKEHPRDRPNVSAIDRCRLYRGLTKRLLKSQQNSP